MIYEKRSQSYYFFFIFANFFAFFCFIPVLYISFFIFS